MKSGGMDDLSDEAAEETNKDLRDQELKLLVGTAVDWDRLRPQIADQATYDAFIKVIQASTAQNESLAQLKTRMKALGSQGLGVARKVLDLMGHI